MLINYFLILITLLLISGLAVDVGMVEWRQIGIQNAADAAALEGMFQNARGDTNWISEAQTQAANNGYTNGVNNVNVTLVNPPTSGNYIGDTYAVQATVSQTVNTYFMALVNGGKATVSATATARQIPTCVWIMNPIGNSGTSGALQVQSARVAANCGVYINAASGGNLLVDAFAALGSLRNRIVGSSSGNFSTGYVGPHPRYGASVKKDPLAYVTAPTLTTCTYNNKSMSGGAHTLDPGTYCGGLSISGTNVTFNPGLYIIAGGMTISSSAVLTGSGVTFYFTKTSGSSSYSAININNAQLNLTAPTSSSAGGIPGVLFFADRNWVAHGSQPISVQNSSVTSDGIWYCPNVGLSLQGDTVSYYTYTGWVTDSVYQYATTTNFNTNYANLGGISPFHYEDGVLVQ